MTLEPQMVELAAKALSRSSGFWYTRRCLMFELCRRGGWPDPGTYGETGLEGCERDFAVALAEYERGAKRLPRLVRPEEAVPGVGPDDLKSYDLPADLFDYSIQRVALVERMDLCLMLIANGLHREIELALTVPPEFPTHVWSRIRSQLDAGLRTTFLAIHDCGGSSEAWLATIEQQLGSHRFGGAVEIVQAGLTVPWAFRLRLPVRGGGVVRSSGAARGSTPTTTEDEDFAPMLRSGSYALLEELTPLRAMRWIYGRVSRGAEDVGFG
jgi:hypothetical protein